MCDESRLSRITTPAVSVVVVNYNGEHLLPRCLDALVAQTRVDGAVELVVVDNGSTDGSLSLLARWYPEVRVLAASRNTGFAGGVALALRDVTGPIAVLVNNDAVVAPGFLAALLQPFAHSTVGAVCAKVLLAADQRINSVGAEVTVDGYGQDRGWLAPDDGQFDSPTEVFVGSGCALGLRKEAVEQVGGMDEVYFLYYEDIDLTWRLRLSGWSVVTAPDAVVYHEHSATAGAGSPLHLYYSERNRLVTVVKDGSARLAFRAVSLQLVLTLYVAGREFGRACRARRRPQLGELQGRVRMWAGFVRLLPHALQERGQVGRRAVVSRRALESRWLVGPAIRFGPWHRT